jgi:hypothetical protein
MYIGERDCMDRNAKLVPLLCCVMLGLAACASGEQGTQAPSKTENAAPQKENGEATQASAEQSEETTQASATTAEPQANTGTIKGRVTDRETGEPVPNTYILIGWTDTQLAAISDAGGRYTVPNVPAGDSTSVLGFHEGQYLYKNSSYHDDLKFVLEPGETVTYDFSVRQHDDPEGQPEVSDPAISTETAAPGERVTFELTASGGEGGLSPEVFAASPKLGKVVLLKAVDGDRFRAGLTIPEGTPPGEYPFAFFAASKKCYDPEVFPELTLRVT